MNKKRLDLKSNIPKSYINLNKSIDLGGEKIDAKELKYQQIEPTFTPWNSPTKGSPERSLRLSFDFEPLSPRPSLEQQSGRQEPVSLNSKILSSISSALAWKLEQLYEEQQQMELEAANAPQIGQVQRFKESSSSDDIPLNKATSNLPNTPTRSKTKPKKKKRPKKSIVVKQPAVDTDYLIRKRRFAGSYAELDDEEFVDPDNPQPKRNQIQIQVDAPTSPEQVGHVDWGGVCDDKFFNTAPPPRDRKSVV